MNSERCSQCKHFIIANAGEGKIYGCDRSKCVFEPTTKNDLGVDLISRADVLQILLDYDYANENALVLKDIKELPSITPQPCEDAISRQALLNATVNKNSIWNKTTDSKGENLETIISKLPSVTPQPRWIPVSERLPDTDDEVLCWYEYYHWSQEKVLPDYGIGCYFKETSAWYGEVAVGRDVRVIAWMPLQPYKAESEADNG